VQATSSRKQVTVDDLALDLYAVNCGIHRGANSAFMEAIVELDLSLTQCKVLNILEYESEEQSVKELAEQIGISLAAASRTVEILHQRAFVHRREDVEDRRMKRVRITDAGRAATRRLGAAKLEALRDFVGTLSDNEREKLSAGLASVVTRPEIAAYREEPVR